jgi:hypothetical protein
MGNNEACPQSTQEIHLTEITRLQRQLENLRQYLAYLQTLHPDSVSPSITENGMVVRPGVPVQHEIANTQSAIDGLVAQRTQLQHDLAQQQTNQGPGLAR